MDLLYLHGLLVFTRHSLKYSFHYFYISNFSWVHFQWIFVQNDEIGVLPNLNRSHLVLNAENLSSSDSDS